MPTPLRFARFVLEELLTACPTLKKDALADKIVYGINARHTFPNGKKKDA